jgi:hypothetical protein
VSARIFGKRSMTGQKTYHLGNVGQVVLVLQAEADDGGMEKGREERAGAVASHDAREVPELDVDERVVVGADPDGLEVGRERRRGLREWLAGSRSSQEGRETHRDERVVDETAVEHTR